MALRPRLLDWPASSTFKPHQVAATRRPRTEARVRRLGDARGIDKSRPVTEVAARYRRTYLYGPAVCCKPDVSDGGIGLALLYPARE